MAFSSPDNGSAYISTIPRGRLPSPRDPSPPHPTLPTTDHGKAERFIRTNARRLAYGAIYRSSTERTAALTGWLDWYNTRRPHDALNHKPPSARLNELNNLLGSYS